MSGVRCGLMIEPSEDCYEVCMLSHRCGALKEWECKNGKTRKHTIFKEMLGVKSEQKTERWIPVSEKLPIKKFNCYWICTNNGYQCQCRWTDDRFGIGVGGLEWGWHIMDVPQYSYVVAWRELPEPYKEAEYD